MIVRNADGCPLHPAARQVSASVGPPRVEGVRGTVPWIPEFAIFAATLCAVALLHRHTLPAALAGVTATVVLKLCSLGLSEGAHWMGALVAHEWTTWLNIVLILLGFATMANHFERSGLADLVPRLLPRNWTGGVALLAFVFVLSAFLDNIAAAMIGGIVARHYYDGPIRTAFLAAIVAAANAGGAGSVVGDTTTTMMWIGGISPLTVLPAFVPSFVAFAVFAPIAAYQQARRAPVVVRRLDPQAMPIDWPRAVIVVVLLLSIVAINTVASAAAPELYQSVPWLGLGLWIAIGCSALWRRPAWSVLGAAAYGAVFLAALVALAAMMPVEYLPPPTWKSTIGLGVLSAIFDNIPLTALALKQGGYDWALLAYAVGFGGSMVWFGSSAGVALSGLYPGEVRSAVKWAKDGWFIPVAYAAGCAAFLLLV
jgi:Na+/H+ antiporter NhaD/arsenite permease-like protein